MIYIPLGIIASIPLYYSLKKSFRRNIIYVHIIFILLTAIPFLAILFNIVSVKFDEDKMSLFEPYNPSCSIYQKGIIEENVYVRLKETFESRFFRFFARDGCFNEAVWVDS